MAAIGRSENIIKKYLPVYFTLLAIPAIEVILSYRNFAMPSLLAMLLALAFCGATLGTMYFMHLSEECRTLFLTLIPATIFVLLLMNAIWSDSLRLLHMRPFAN